MSIYQKVFQDIYQDNFNEGIFTGKGIYDLQIFSKVLKNVIPENTVLSHDLLEGTKKISKETIEANIEVNASRVDYSKIKNDVREVLGKFFYKETGAKPMIITVVQEI